MLYSGTRLTNRLGLDHKHNLTRTIFMIMVGFIALCCASQLSIPYTPVPLTFQSATVILLGLLYGSRYASYIIILYLGAGIMGVPVFADYSAGFVKLIGPTGGYLIGFLPAAWLCGYMSEKGFAKHWFSAFIVAVSGSLVIFTTGWLMLGTFVGFQTALEVGVLPFIIPELIKLLALCFLVSKVWQKSSAC